MRHLAKPSFLFLALAATSSHASVGNVELPGAQRLDRLIATLALHEQPLQSVTIEVTNNSGEVVDLTQAKTWVDETQEATDATSIASTSVPVQLQDGEVARFKLPLNASAAAMAAMRYGTQTKGCQFATQAINLKDRALTPNSSATSSGGATCGATVASVDETAREWTVSFQLL
ncbi:hypothetical protein [Luteibacter yeojuensis]|uniref:Uncharacterized protein n=1 Tax=Luteibacter yeojuensis TaxID=345309 RepID=A0A7X5TPI3_9GAMM|nr:hypothetical protein [Luteibacter yeojuensis]NID14823.1 hypothetical protein [Luteibacter yeojuensis]